LPAPVGACSSVVAWPSASAWFDAVMDVLSTPEGEAERRAAKVARDTLLRVAYADRLAADRRTGRDMATAHETVAHHQTPASRLPRRCEHRPRRDPGRSRSRVHERHPYVGQDAYRAAERDAKEHARGFWGECPTPSASNRASTTLCAPLTP
jgi:hypothetical protein